MAKKKKRKKFKKLFVKERRPGRFSLPEEISQKIWGVLMILLAVIISLSFFGKAGTVGQLFMKGARFLIGEIVFLIPLIFVLAGLAFLATKYQLNVFKEKKRIFWPIILAILILISGIVGLTNIFDPLAKKGGWLGYILGWPFLKYFGFWATQIIFLALITIGLLIFCYFLRSSFQRKKDVALTSEEKKPAKPSIIKKIFGPKFRVKEISPFISQKTGQEDEKQLGSLKLESKPIAGLKTSSYQPPSTKLLESDRGIPNSGDTGLNSAIIKKTLENFGIQVTMSEINIGPTVTQYTLKPAEGIKLSKITNLSNDLALALASHPIRIEAPIPGRSLVGLEVPNKIRTQVRLRNLIENPNFEKSTSNLIIALGRNVSGVPVYADLTKMPHLLVAGSTGTGKSIFLNSLIQSLLYQPSTAAKSASPENIRFVLIDPKRVEFSIYNNLSHLLCPVIYSVTQAVNVLKWLIKEMERRFDLLSETKVRDISSYNEKALKDELVPLPFIIVIIDELADLMAAKGREIEAEVVRLAQMSRAVGIHLIVATQRPSVEVITGLIKANITSRITFQVASQVDSRTVLDTAGAEKLLGLGDMLYISAEIVKPKRIQGAYVSEKEIKRVVNYIISKEESLGPKTEIEAELLQELGKSSAETESKFKDIYSQEDPLYEEAKRVVIEARKASASLLQRRLRIGYARAARLIDILEARGMVGPGEGAKPREVYGEAEGTDKGGESESSEDEEGWKKV